MRYAKAPVVRFHDGNTDGDYDGGTQEGDNTLYYTHDANWNTTAVVDGATGAVAERYYYDAYGQAHFCNPSTWAEIQWSGSLQNEVLYGGYGFDAESGLYHTDAREYHGSLGRFIQVDPIGAAGGPNVYAYCNDSPADTVDPSGLEPDWAKAAAGIMFVALSAMQTQAAISLGGSVFGMLGVTGGYGGFAAGMAMIVSAFSPDPRLDQVAEAGAMIQLVASAPAFVASVVAAGGSMLRRAGAVFNGVRVAEQQVASKTAHAARHLQGTGLASGVRSANPTPGLGNIGSHSPVSPETVLNGAGRWLGSGYSEVSPGSGVFRSADGLRQFRMTTRDLLPTHGNIGPHVHFEVPNPTGGPPLENLHLPVTP